MKASRPLYRSFAGGEITPELFGRIDLTKHQTGLALARNFWTLAHGPWSLWMLIGASAAFALPAVLSLEVILLSALAPTVWTAALMLAYCGRVLGDDRRRALWRTAAHQLVMWSCIIGYLALATQIWPRLLGRLAA